MIEIINPGWPSLIVDGGRFGEAAVGVPSSSALDLYAFRAAQCLTGQGSDTPVLEVMGASFALRFDCDMTCAITGARVKARLNDRSIRPWASFRAAAGSLLRILEVGDGLRYYIGFSGMMALESVIGSYTTNVECGFGGYQGRLLRARDRLEFIAISDVAQGILPENQIPQMHPPHRLRVVEGPEASFFTDESLDLFMGGQTRVPYGVSTQTNRTGIRLEGAPLVFRREAEKSIISEGILSGTIQIPGDGQPIIMLRERTIGGYARVALVAKADQDRLAHVKPGDPVFFDRISQKAALALWQVRREEMDSIDKNIIWPA
jgi:biotin-dependent carboxylase-like uncharacterized protein